MSNGRSRNVPRRRAPVLDGKIVLWLALVAAIAAVAFLVPTIKAWLENGKPSRVPAGVHLVETPVGGLSENELRATVHDLARRYETPPVDACWDERTGSVRPERDGVALDVEATVAACLEAARGARVEPVLVRLPASIRRDFFAEVDSGDGRKRVVAFMFNVAWGEEYLDQILDRLEANAGKSTFFLDGAWVQKFPERVKAIHERGHEVANHGYRHDHILDMPRDGLVDLIRKNEDLLRTATGAEPARLFAPPYGERDARIIRTAAELGYRTVMWTIDTLDWRRPPPEEIAGKVLRKLVNGAFVLMHPTEQTVKALDLLLPELKAKGFQLVTVTDALGTGP